LPEKAEAELLELIRARIARSFSPTVLTDNPVRSTSRIAARYSIE
jgi:hypothetical protein